MYIKKFSCQSGLHFFLDKKTKQKNQGLERFRYFSLFIPKQNKLASLKQYFVFNGIICRKMAAEKFKADLLRLTTERY